MPEKKPKYKSITDWIDGHSPERKARRVATKKRLEAAPKPTVEVGSHLTVTTWPDGHTTLHWDDDALLREVKAAIASTQIKKKRTPKTK